jgi:putative transposase
MEPARRLVHASCVTKPSTAGIVFHAVNRATEGQLLFRDHGEYLAFHHLLAQALAARPIRLLAYCLMPNHWHMVLWPAADGEMATFFQWLCATHARRAHRWRGTEGRGAVYQSRFRRVPVETETYFYRVVRYVERNARRAGLAERAEAWPWTSASPVSRVHGTELAPWPLARPKDWLLFVNEVEPIPDVDFIRERTARRKPICQSVPGRAKAAIKD